LNTDISAHLIQGACGIWINVVIVNRRMKLHEIVRGKTTLFGRLHASLAMEQDLSLEEELVKGVALVKSFK
jgi:hypothetical protein